MPSEGTVVKFVVAGGFGVGKTTFVRSVSEIEPLETEAVITVPSVGIDSTDNVPGKDTTTVAFDFGRRTLDDDITVYVFGTPGQDRFWFMWESMARGAIGAIVMVDTRDLAGCFASVDFFERRGIPFLVAVNAFDEAPGYSADHLRDALELAPHIPLMQIDARDPRASDAALVALIDCRLRPTIV